MKRLRSPFPFPWLSFYRWWGVDHNSDVISSEYQSSHLLLWYPLVSVLPCQQSMRCPCSLGWGYLLRGPIVFFQKFLKLASNNSPFAAQHVSCCQIGWVLVVTGVGYLRLLVYKFQNPIQDFGLLINYEIWLM